MFLFFRRKNVIAVPVLCLSAIAIFLAGCDLSGGVPEPDPEPYSIGNALQRVWEFHDPGNAANDRYIAITGTAYTEYKPGLLDGTTNTNGDAINSGKDTITVTGTIEGITDDTLPAGYIYVKADDDYFAVRWENYAGTSVKLWSTYNETDGRQSSLAAAQTAYGDTYDSNWQHLVQYTKVNTLVGNLKGTYAGTGTGTGSVVEITDITYTDSYTGYGVTYSGIIVETTDPDKAEGHIYIKYAQTTFGTPNNYYAIHWQNKTAGSIELSGASHGNGQSTLDLAKAEYVKENGYFTIHTTFLLGD